MIDRLRDQAGSSDPVVARAAEIVRSLEPLQPAPARMQRVWGAIANAPAPARSLPRLRAGMGAAVVAAAATAAAGWIAHRSSGAEHPAVAPALRTVPPVHAAPIPSTVAALSPGQPSASPPPEHPIAPPAQARVESPSPHVRAAPSPAAPADEASQAALVIDALRALRQEHDPARAAALVDEYLAFYPTGSLVEEALATDIEAQSALDSPRAATLARDYLARFPKGRFVVAAKAAEARFGR